jgi:hypothetical protein
MNPGADFDQHLDYMRYYRIIMKKYSERKKINRIEKRSIEALAIAPIIDMVSKKIGNDEALEILKKIVKS